MKFLFTLLLLLAIPVLAQVPQGTSMRATNGIGFGVTTIGGRFLATNTIANGGSNEIGGELHIGRTRWAGLPPGHGELLTVYHDTTNAFSSYGSSVYSVSKFSYTSNINHLNVGVSSLMTIGAANTGDWTNVGYPELVGFNASIQPDSGSSGTIRNVAGYFSTIAGAFPIDTGAKFDQGVGYWFDTASAGNNLSNIVGFKASGLNAGWNNTGLWLGVVQNTRPEIGNWGVWDETGYPSRFSGNVSSEAIFYGDGSGLTNLPVAASLWFTNPAAPSSISNAYNVGVIGKVSIGSTGSPNTLDVIDAALSASASAIKVTGTLAASASSEVGSSISITGSGSGANANTAQQVLFNAGYTGSGFSMAQRTINASVGTGLLGWSAGAANYGTHSSATPFGGGHNVGVFGSGSGSTNLNIGVYGQTRSTVGPPLLNVGVVGMSHNAPTIVGGFFGLHNNAVPTISSSAALIADNYTTTDNMIIWQDNGTIVGGIADGGVLHGDGSGLTNLAGATTSSFWFTNPAPSTPSISNTYNVKTTGSIQSSNTTTPNTALTLNGAATGGTGQVIVYRTNNADKFAVIANGNVGIGTGNPGTILQVRSSGTSDAVMAPGTAQTGSFTYLNSDGVYGFSMGVRYLTGDVWMQVARIDGTATSYNLLLQPSGGNVGIGLTAPTNKLQVIGAIQSTTTVFANTATITNNIVSSAGIFHGNASGVSNAVDLIAGDNVTITPDADGRTFTIESSGGAGDGGILGIEAGANITITTNSATSLTIASSAASNFILDLDGSGTNTTFYGPLSVANYINATNSTQTNTISGRIQQGGTASSAQSAAFGLNTQAKATAAFVTGIGSDVAAAGSLVGGRSNVLGSGAIYSLVAGNGNNVQGINNFAVGANNQVDGDNGAAIGRGILFDSSAHNCIGIGVGIAFANPTGDGASNTIAIAAGESGMTVTRSNSFEVLAPTGSFFQGGPVAPTSGILWESGAQLTNIYTATATLDFGNVATIGCADLTITVTGAALGDVVDLGVPNASVVANSSYSAWVSAADTVTVRFCALISGDPASGVFRAEVHKWR